jgi:hypothetical protein
LPAVCAGPWAALLEIFAPPDAGVPESVDAGITVPPPDMPVAHRHGCGCSLGARAPGGEGSPVFILLSGALLVALRRRA